MFYFVKIPRWLKWLYKGCIWDIKNKEKSIYLTFDDGPHPTITPFVLDELKKHQAKATFFCIGKNVAAFPEVFQRIIDEGHSIGNHTFNHLNGWKVSDEEYLNDIWDAKNHIDSPLFRPPYGRITRFQIKQLQQKKYQLKVLMWNILSGDFDQKISKEVCAENVILNAKEGAIVVFHDSEKAKERLSYALPKVLDYFANQGFEFKKIDQTTIAPI